MISAIRLSMRLIISAKNLVPLYSRFQKDKSPVNHKKKKKERVLENQEQKAKNSEYISEGQNSQRHYSYSR